MSERLVEGPELRILRTLENVGSLELAKKQIDYGADFKDEKLEVMTPRHSLRFRRLRMLNFVSHCP